MFFHNQGQGVTVLPVTFIERDAEWLNFVTVIFPDASIENTWSEK
jgi:hypothetical protein